MLCPICKGAGATDWQKNSGDCWLCQGACTSDQFGPSHIILKRFNVVQGMSSVVPKAGAIFHVAPKETHSNFTHIARDLGWFKSASEAKRNGWDAPLSNKEHTVGKRTIRIIEG